MTSANALTPLDPTDYNAIEAAVMETTRGRWFLAEYAKRNRNADTDMLLGAIGRLEEAVAGERTSQDLDRLRFDLMEMAKSISRTKSEIAALRPNGDGVTQLEEATEALDAIVRTTERATSEILEAAETIQETAWTLRERDVDDSLCDVLDRRATDIYTACSFQDLTAQRISKVVHVMRYLEGRINAMIDIWGGVGGHHSAYGAAHADSADAPLSGIDMSMTQSDIDDVIVDEDLFESGSSKGSIYDTSPVLSRHATISPLINDGDIMFAEEQPHLTASLKPEPESAISTVSGMDDVEFCVTAADQPHADVHDVDHAADSPVLAASDAMRMTDNAAGTKEASPDAAMAAARTSADMLTTGPSLVEDEATPDLLRRRAFAQIDAMSAAEKLRHFT